MGVPELRLYDPCYRCATRNARSAAIRRVVLPAGTGAVSEINDVGAAGTHRVLAAIPVAHAAAEMVLKKICKMWLTSKA